MDGIPAEAGTHAIYDEFGVVEVGSNRKGIVEELEKAHIYISQLNKKNSVLENRIARLEKMILSKISIDN